MKNYPVVSFFVVFLGLPVTQAQEAVFDYNLNSPYDTIVTHLGYLKKGNYHPEIAAKAFSQEYRTPQEAAVLAMELQQLLKESKVDIDLSQVPKDMHYVDPKAKYHKYQLTQVFPEIYLAKVNNQWFYSEETAQNIEALSHKKLYPLGIKKLNVILPHSLKKSFWGLHLWQHALLLLLFLFVAGIYKAFSFLFKKWAYRFSKRWITSQLLTIKRLISFLVALLVFILALPAIQLPAALEQAAIRLLKGVLTLFITALCYEWINILAPHVSNKRDNRHAKKTRQLNVQLMLLAKPFMRLLVVLIGILFTLKFLNFDISHMLAGISIGGIGFALASQDTIKNFFGTLTIFMDHPFGVGDTIVTGNIKGTVEEIGLRATRIRTHHQSVIYVPNAKLLDTHIDNHGLQNCHCVDVHIAIAHDTTPTLTEAFIQGLSKINRQRTYTRGDDKYHTHLEGIHNATLKILFRVNFDAHNQAEELQYRHEVLSDITKLAEGLGIHLASLSTS